MLAKWVNLCPALMGFAKPFEALKHHLRAEVGLHPNDLTLLLDVVSEQAKKTKKKTSAKAKKNETMVVVAMTNSARNPNARQKRNQRTGEKRAAESVGKRKKNEVVYEDSGGSVLVGDLLAANPQDIAVALTARHWAIFGPIPPLDRVGTSLTSSASPMCRVGR